MTTSYSASRTCRVEDTYCFYFTTWCLSSVGVLPGRDFCVTYTCVSRPQNIKASQRKNNCLDSLCPECCEFYLRLYTLVCQFLKICVCSQRNVKYNPAYRSNFYCENNDILFTAWAFYKLTTSKDIFRRGDCGYFNVLNANTILKSFKKSLRKIWKINSVIYLNFT